MHRRCGRHRAVVRAGPSDTPRTAADRPLSETRHTGRQHRFEHGILHHGEAHLRDGLSAFRVSARAVHRPRRKIRQQRAAARIQKPPQHGFHGCTHGGGMRSAVRKHPAHTRIAAAPHPRSHAHQQQPDPASGTSLRPLFGVAARHDLRADHSLLRGVGRSVVRGVDPLRRGIPAACRCAKARYRRCWNTTNRRMPHRSRGKYGPSKRSGGSEPR